MSMGLKEAAPSLTSAVVSESSVGTKLSAEEEVNPAPVRVKGEAVRGTENASEVEAKRAKTIEQVIFMLSSVAVASDCLYFEIMRQPI